MGSNRWLYKTFNVGNPCLPSRPQTLVWTLMFIGGANIVKRDNGPSLPITLYNSMAPDWVVSLPMSKSMWDVTEATFYSFDRHVSWGHIVYNAVSPFLGASAVSRASNSYTWWLNEMVWDLARFINCSMESIRWEIFLLLLYDMIMPICFVLFC